MRVGDVLDDRYELREKLGQGGFGVVWRAQDTRVGRPVAVKVIRHDDGDQAKAALRFAREASAAGNLSHPHIVTVHDLGHSEADDQQVTYLVMELLTGRTLTQVIREGRPDPQVGLRWARQICEALAAAHDAGMVHRDVKPDNVMITEDGLAKVLDFGIAQLDVGASGLTTVGTVIGSPPYMAPERWTGGRVDGRADLYALGCVLVELFTGKRLFTGDSTPVLMYQHLNEPPPAVDPVKYGLPRQLPDLLVQLLAKEPADRPADARAVAQRFADLAEGRELPPTATPVDRVGPDAAAPEPAAPESMSPEPTGPKPTGPEPTTPEPAAPKAELAKRPAPVRRRAPARQPKLRPVGRPALLYPAPRPVGRPVEPPGPVEDAVAVRARLAATVGAVQDERPAAAVHRLRPVVEAAVRSLGGTDPEVVAARRDLARHLDRDRRPAQAVGLLEDLLADLQPVLGQLDPQVLEVRYDLAGMVRRSGHPATAVRLLTALLPALRSARGPRGPLVLQAGVDLAACSAQLGDFPAAAARLEELLPQLVEAFGPAHRRCVQAGADLAEYRKRARFHRAPHRAVRAWRVRIDRDQALRLVRWIRTAGEPVPELSRELERGTGVKGLAERVASAPPFVSDEDLLVEVFGP
ncbi:protein kinase [Kitasatospora sp. NPDC028055]|uniref:serine/threonine-protein kinase n=1 Tax=Kitasatospora sp. NPDC028055 TaxID=3155653 RepID=UPI0033D2BBF6